MFQFLVQTHVLWPRLGKGFPKNVKDLEIVSILDVEKPFQANPIDGI